MLVLTRKEQQQIRIGHNILLTIVRVKGNTVRIGIEAPLSLRITRPEQELDGSPDAPAEAVDAVTVSADDVAAAAGPVVPLSSPVRRDPHPLVAAERVRPLAGHVRPRTAGLSIRPPQRLSPAGLRSVVGRR